MGWEESSLRSLQLKLVGHATSITNGLGHFYYIGGHRQWGPSSTGLGPFLPPDPSPKGSLVAIRVMKHPATSGHALGTRSVSAAAACTHPHPVRLASGSIAMQGPTRTTPRHGGSPGQSSRPTSPQPRVDRVGSESRPEPRVTFPITPSRLPACTPEGRSAERSGAASREQGERPSPLSPSSSATAAALTPETELAGAARLSPLRVPWRLLLRGAGQAS